MESKLNIEKIKSYSLDFADIVCRNFFKIKDKITGNEILSVTSSKQINLFVLKNLFYAWEKESDKLKSNYFNYEFKTVQI